MSDDDDLLSRANSLINADAAAARGERRNSPRQMRRRRSFLASANPDGDSEGGARFVRRSAEDDDLPLLTDVVAAEVEPAPGVDEIAAGLRPTLAAELAALVNRQVADALPLLVETAAHEAAERLREGIEARIAVAAGDFVARRGQLQLPLEDPVDNQTATPDQA